MSVPLYLAGLLLIPGGGSEQSISRQPCHIAGEGPGLLADGQVLIVPGSRPQ